MGVGEMFSSVFINFRQLGPKRTESTRTAIVNLSNVYTKELSYFQLEDDTVCSYGFPLKWSVDGLRLVLVP